MDYYALKHLHMSLAALSGSLFLFRGIWLLGRPDRLPRRWMKVAPHLVDSLLLASAIGLAVWSSQYPGQMPWLSAKVTALVAYIVLGALALKPGRPRGVRIAAFVGALLCFAYIVSVALTKNPLVFG
jgi:uncharacterized membrane protein SirB2